MMGMSHLISEFYPNSEMPSTLLKMKAVPSNAAFCKHGTTRRVSILLLVLFIIIIIIIRSLC